MQAASLQKASPTAATTTMTTKTEDEKKGTIPSVEKKQKKIWFDFPVQWDENDPFLNNIISTMIVIHLKLSTLFTQKCFKKDV